MGNPGVERVVPCLTVWLLPIFPDPNRKKTLSTCESMYIYIDMSFYVCFLIMIKPFSWPCLFQTRIDVGNQDGSKWNVDWHEWRAHPADCIKCSQRTMREKVKGIEKMMPNSSTSLMLIVLFQFSSAEMIVDLWSDCCNPNSKEWCLSVCSDHKTKLVTVLSANWP